MRSGRHSGKVPLVVVESRGRTPLYEQIYASLREQITGRRLRAGARLASTRTLAIELEVSRFTVVTAVDRLLAEGYLTTRHGSGTFVADVLPELRMGPRAGGSSARTASGSSVAPSLSSRGTALSAVVISGPRHEHGPLPFHPRRPALDLFPRSLWARIISRHWRSAKVRDLDYGEPAGLVTLRQAIAEHVGVSRALQCDPSQVIVTSGAQQAFDMLFRLLLDPGDAVWMEEPGYLDVRASLVGAGAKLVPVPVDRDGLDVSAGIARAPRARMAVVSPSHQYPMGATMIAPRRAALIDWARAAGAWIIEDDYDSFFRYRGRPIPALYQFDLDTAASHAPRVVHVGTFSKTMFPSLRLGFCVVPEALIDAAANARAVASRNAPIVDQMALATFIAEGHYDRHLRRARLVYAERYEAMRRAFARELGDVLTLTAPSAGTHVLAWFRAGTKWDRASRTLVPRIARAAADEGLVVFPLSRYALEPRHRDGFVLGYGAISPRQIDAAVLKLARVIARTV